MIVKNEEKNIERAIRSALPVADEIIVVDTGSTDNTVQIVRDLIGRVYFSPWMDDFAHARNKSISFASKDLIMWLDADDVIPESTISVIQHIKDNGKENTFYSGMVKCTEVCNINYVIKPLFKQGRIFPNRRGVYFQNKIHESFAESAIAAGINYEHIDNLIIEHVGYSSNEELEKKRRRNIRLIMCELGFPSNVDYYEFEYLNCLCIYTPNVVVAWRGIEYIGACDVDYDTDMDKSIRKSVDVIVQRYNNRSGSALESLKKTIDRIERNGLSKNI